MLIFINKLENKENINTKLWTQIINCFINDLFLILKNTILKTRFGYYNIVYINIF